MSKCKKLITILLCGIMVFGMSLTAFAETPTPVPTPATPTPTPEQTPNPPQSNNINEMCIRDSPPAVQAAADVFRI